MKTPGRAPSARRAAGGADETVVAALRDAGGGLDEGARGDGPVDEAAIAWTKAVGAPAARWTAAASGSSWPGRASRSGGSPSSTCITRTEAPRYVRIIETLHRLLEAERPDEVEAVGLPAAETRARWPAPVPRAGILFQGRPGACLAPRAARLAGRWRSRLQHGSRPAPRALKAALAGRRRRRRRPTDARTVLFLSHAAFWRERRDPQTEAGRGLRALLRPADPGGEAADGGAAAVRGRGGPARGVSGGAAPRERVGDWSALPPRRTGRTSTSTATPTPRVHARGAAAARAQVRRAWRRAAAERRRCARPSRTAGSCFADLAEPDLAATMLLQLPWAVRCYEEMAAVLAPCGPAVVCLYAESSGWGRAALAACRAAGVPTVAVQHGILYPQVLLVPPRCRRGGLPAPGPHRRVRRGGPAAAASSRAATRRETLVATGSPKFDDLLRGARGRDRRDAAARGWAWATASRLVVVASRFRHPAARTRRIGTAFPALRASGGVAAGRARLVKPHPAEPPDAYDAVLRAGGAAASALVAAGRGPGGAAARGRRAGHRGVAVRGGGAGARPARCWC